ncbi:MAG: hypothetical protein KDE54_19445 [Caldilineaceae bacterium]|nr:hypothetical protein [Caldilineaceae bacterium]MCB0141970.1 hypothetical protein [Caldilineaceae bacterium]
MSRLQLNLLGDFRARIDGTEITEFQSNRARALLAYVALHADRPLRRELLASLLWDADVGDRGLTNLRSTLRRVQNALQQKKNSAQFLLINRHSIQFDAALLNNFYCSPGNESVVTEATEARIDALAFAQLWAEIAAHGHNQIDDCVYCIERLRRAAALYAGPLLAYLYIDSPPFETWLLAERERLQRFAMRGLHLLADHYLKRRQFTKAEQYARRQIALEGWNEEAHVQLMNIFYMDGKRSTALAQYQACAIALSQELDVEPQPETNALFEAIVSSIPPEQARHLLSAAAAAALDHVPPMHNLPPVEQALIGRAQERDRLLYHLGISHNRLVTLVGPGGIGKTRLALDVAHALVDSFAHGVWLVELHGVETSGGEDETEQAIAALVVETIGAPPADGLPKERLLAHLWGRKALLLLDNFEHLTAGAGLIHDVLKQAPDVCIMVTSRQQIDLRSAHVVALSGLPVPPAGEDIMSNAQHVDDMLSYAAVQLLVASIQRQWPNFALDFESMPLVVEICRYLGGLPLGLQLAAGNVLQVGLSSVLQSLQSNQYQGVAPWRDAPQRHQSLANVFSDSWQLLSAVEQDILARLAVFRAGFQLSAAVAVVGDALENSIQAETQKVLNLLIKKSLLLMLQNGRYRLHEYIHQFASAKLAEIPVKQNAVAEAHATSYCEWINGQVPLLRSAKSVATLDQMSIDLANLNAAWRWSTEHGRFELLDQAMEGLFTFYLRRHRYYEGIALCEFTVQHLESNLAPTACVLCAMLWVWQGRFSQIVGELAAAEHQNRMAAALLESDSAHSDALRRLAVHTAPHVYAHIIMQRGHQLVSKEGAGATDFFENALKRYRELGDRWNEAHALAALAQQAVSAGNLSMSDRLNQQALRIRKEMGELSYIATTHIDMARLALSNARYDKAENLLAAAQKYYLEVGDWAGASRCRGYLGIVRAYRNHTEAELVTVFENIEALGALHRHAEQVELFAELARIYTHFGNIEQIEMMTQRKLALASQLEHDLVKDSV